MRQNKVVSISLFLLVLLAVEGWYLWQQKRVNQIIKQKLTTAKRHPVLLLGNSHMHFGGYINDQTQAINLAFPSELFIFTYLKIKLLMPKTVLVALNPQHLQKNNDDALKNGLLSEPQYNYLYGLLTPETQQLLYQACPFEQWMVFRAKQWFPFLGTRLKSPVTSDLLGGYKGYKSRGEVTVQDIHRRLQTVFGAYRYQLSLLQLTYLKKIVDYCSQQQIRLIFVGFPLHPNFFAKIPAKVFHQFQKTLEELKYSGSFEYWDYSQQFDESKMFYDPDHLNKQGAKALSKLIFTRLNHQ
ncbi:D-alanyl-lipoteichoic acid biosynthesis protein DltD [Microscilla marina]|uniref:D-alanyl-lipoteichoic acid biosynthesis protein DltD n=1 Tax=Microscilla marina TaxID=1027 RepID=UPI0012FBE037|nr:D-alanyl-lipoteichoic acid biosynthesis protein DltD [Microscilla marina]